MTIFTNGDPSTHRPATDIGSTAELATELRRLLREAEARTGKVIARAGLAKRIGVSQSSMYAYLNGTTFIPEDTFARLLRELDTDEQHAQRLRRARDTLTNPTAPPPRVLPLDVATFTARAEQLAELDRLRGQGRKNATVVIAAITGGAGVGKTALAVRWANQRLSRFPDGCLYVDLRGFHCDRPLDPNEALGALLRRLGTPGAGLPAMFDERWERYQEMLSGKRMLILLDNALSPEQVRPLLPPGTSSCFVLVTSRDQLSGLAIGQGAHRLPVDALTEAEARALLCARLGPERVGAEPEAVARLLAVCAGLPLALNIVASRVQARPGVLLAEVADELGNTASRLTVLNSADPATSVGTALLRSLALLTAQQTEIFKLLGIAPGQDISLQTAASLIGRPPAEAKAALEELERVSLVRQDISGQYRMHNVVRDYAAHFAHRDLPRSVRETALRRVAEF
ncbi:NB-ARC domain-containing protein [Streptomyces sp. W16]|uniref:NB-ARC domain-containing protein n=1 Tax=Streptomyces sp. W16 TaxID=3076631 RepID=UPI00295BFF7A|nr:NB-ARC domain-containing protein [Streptomyces sp. W16]MDV9170862.1 NB-ARC domain-containing protein [Streptomyces sp. W16]